MRIIHASVLTLVLSATSSVCGQSAKLSPPTSPNVVTVTQAATPVDQSATPVISVLDDAPPGLEEGSLPANCVPQLFWFRADYLVWWIRKETPPTIVSTLPDSLALANTIPASAGTTVFPLNNQLNFKPFDGLRINTGIWLNNNRTIGIDVSGFMTEQNSKSGSYTSAGSPIFARNYLNSNNGQPFFLEFSNPAPVVGYSGTISAAAAVSNIYSGDINARVSGYRIFADNTDWLLGVRYFQFRERLDINGSINLVPQIKIQDHFSTTNNFYGGQLGIQSRWCGWHGFSVDTTLKLALGDMSQTVNISGSNSLVSPGGAVNTQPGGLFAQPSNIGTFHKDKIAAIPDLGLNLNYSFTSRAAIFAGYNFIYAGNIVRAGNTIDPSVNASNLRYLSQVNMPPGNVAGPLPIFKEQGVWLQGINVGLRVEY